jgi:hypothetical protein
MAFPGGPRTVAGATGASARHALYGNATLPLDSLGAVAPGDIGSRDQSRPGVLVIDQSPDIMLRFGSDANRSDLTPFDGAYMAVTVKAITPTGFVGEWRSGGAMVTDNASGHICAERVKP